MKNDLVVEDITCTNPIEVLEKKINEHNSLENDEFGLLGSLVGSFSYDAVNFMEDLQNIQPLDDVEMFRFIIVDSIVAIDHLIGKVTITILLKLMSGCFWTAWLAIKHCFGGKMV